MSDKLPTPDEFCQALSEFRALEGLPNTVQEDERQDVLDTAYRACYSRMEAAERVCAEQAERIRTLESLYRRMREVAGAQEHHSNCALKRKTGTICDCHQKSIWAIDIEFDRIRAALPKTEVKP